MFQTFAGVLSALVLMMILFLSAFPVKEAEDQEIPSPSISQETEVAVLFQRLRERRESRPKIFQGRSRAGGCASCG